MTVKALPGSVDATLETFCAACFGAEYPLEISAEDRAQLPLFGQNRESEW